MGGETRLPRECVLPAATRLYAALKPACEKITIVGSLRRERETVGDVEVVCTPILELIPDALGELVQETTPTRLERVLKQLCAEGALAADLKVKRNGSELKRYIIPDLDGMPFEIYLCDEWEYGYQCMIRTGDADFTHKMMTERPGGLKPSHIDCKGGAKVMRNGRMVRLELHNERELFDAWGLPVLHPRERDMAGVEKLKGMMKR